MALVPYNQVFSLEADHGEPELAVEEASIFILSLRTNHFTVCYEDGKAFVCLKRNMNPLELRELGQALIKATDPYSDEIELFRRVKKE